MFKTMNFLLTLHLVKVSVIQSRLTLCDPVDCSPPASSVTGSPGKNTGVGCRAPETLPDRGSKPRSPALQVGSVLSEPPGKPSTAQHIQNYKFPTDHSIAELKFLGMLCSHFHSIQGIF